MQKSLFSLITVVFFSAPGLPGRASAGEKPTLDAWKKTSEELLEEMRHTVRRRDLEAFSLQFADLIAKGAEPYEGFRHELTHLLPFAPAGVILNTLVKTLLENGDPQGTAALFEALSRKEFKDFNGRDCGQGEVEARHRVLEFYILQFGDRLHALQSQAKGDIENVPPPMTITPLLEEKLIAELSSEEERRVRCAAYVLGGSMTKSAASALLNAAQKPERTPFTQAVLVEALGRTDPGVGGEKVESLAEAKNEQVRLAAIPLLGFISSPKADDLIRQASESTKWTLRRAAIEACNNRRDRFAMDLLMARFSKETPRLQYDILQVLQDIVQGALPPDPKEWQKWWRLAREGYKPEPKGKPKISEKARVTVVVSQPLYFGLELWSNQVAIVLDISGSMDSSNLSLGTSGVAVAGAMKEGSPLAVAKDQIQRLLKTFHSRTLFTVIAYNQEVKPLSEGLLPATSNNLQKAIKYVRDLKADGGTNVYGGLVAALRDPNVDTIQLLSDGEPTDGARTEPDDILEAIQMLNRFRKTRINTIQIGDDLELMKELARSSGGHYKLLALSAEAKAATKASPDKGKKK